MSLTKLICVTADTARWRRRERPPRHRVPHGPRRRDDSWPPGGEHRRGVDRRADRGQLVRDQPRRDHAGDHRQLLRRHTAPRDHLRGTPVGGLLPRSVTRHPPPSPPARPAIRGGRRSQPPPPRRGLHGCPGRDRGGRRRHAQPAPAGHVWPTVVELLRPELPRQHGPPLFRDVGPDMPKF